MTPEEILAVSPLTLTQEQREHYLLQGYLLVEDAVDDTRLEDLRAAVREIRDAERDPKTCPLEFEFEVPEGNEEAEIRQLLSAADFHPTLWSHASQPPITDLVVDVIGPDVKFLQANVVFKQPGGRGFPWHQDIASVPCSNLSPLMVFTYLEDVTPEMGPTQFVPGTHLHRPYDHYDEHGDWLGNIGDHDLKRLPTENAVSAVAPAGTALLLNCPTVHTAKRNRASRARPMVINGYVSADTHCYVDISAIFPSQHGRCLCRNQFIKQRIPENWDGWGHPCTGRLRAKVLWTRSHVVTVSWVVATTLTSRPPRLVVISIRSNS